jgi:HEAT repeat protein
MTATLEQLIRVRSQLAEEALAYLDGLAERTAELPKYYPERLRAAEAGNTPFDDIRQVVQVVEDRAVFERYLAEVGERMRAAGQDFDRIAYKPKRSLMEEEESDERDRTDRDRPAPPPPFQWDENAGSRFKRAVILGDPGFGKTWLLRYEARRLARAAVEQLRNRLCDLDQITLPIFIRLSELNQSDNPIEDALVEAVSAGRSAAFRNFVCEKLATECCVVLLDAWDEVPIEVPPKGQPIAFLPHYRQRLGQRLDVFSRQFTQPRILMTSRIVGYDKSPIPDLSDQEQVKELELLAFDTPQVESFARIWFGDDKGVVNQFLAMLRQNHQVRGLARIPLMLTLLCRVWQEQQLTSITRRAELYDCCLRGLLRDWKIDDKGHEREDESVGEAYVEAMIELLQAVSYVLFVEGYEQFNPTLLRAKMQQWLEQLRPGHELCGRTAASLIAELKRDGVFIIAGEYHDAPLLFLHRTFQEYLAASVLAKQAESAGWKAIERFVSKKAWLPEWEEVICLLAGRLMNPAPLLEILANPQRTKHNPHGDDMFRHRLALAARCLPEIDPAIRKSLSAIIDRITTTAFCLWWDYRCNTRNDAVPHLKRALPALSQINGYVVGPVTIRLYGMGMKGQQFLLNSSQRLPLSDLILCLLQKDRVRGIAEEAAAAMGGALANLEFLNTLAPMLRDQRRDMMSAAATAVKAMGAAAATPDILDALVALLRDTSMNYGLVGIVAAMGKAAATPVILNAIPDLLRGENRYVRLKAAEAVAAMGAESATPDILNALAGLLRDSDYDVRSAGVRAVAAMGTTATTHNFHIALTNLLGDQTEYVRQTAAEAITAMGAATTSQISGALADLLRNQDQTAKIAALRAVAAMGAAVATPDILNALADMLRNQNLDVRLKAAEAVSAMGTVAASPDILNALADMLRNQNLDVRLKAAEAVSAMGTVAASPDIPNALADLLCDRQNQTARIAARQAVAAIGAATATPDFINMLTNLLRDQNWENWEERNAIAASVGAMGAAVATPDFLNTLANLLRDQNCGVRQAAAVAVRAMRAAAATPNILNSLPLLLCDQDTGILAVEAVREMGAAAATPDILNSLAMLLRDHGSYVRYIAPQAVAAMGAAAATTGFLDSLVHLLHNQDSEVNEAATHAIAAIGAAAATPDILTALATLLGDHEWGVGYNAANAVAAMGAAAATPDFLNRLADLLGDQERNVRLNAVRAVTALGAAAATDDILNALALLLRDQQDQPARSHAARAVASMGAAAATPDILNVLADLLLDGDPNTILNVNEAAAEAVAAIGTVAATPNILYALAVLLGYPPTYSAGKAAAKAVEAMGATVATPDFLNTLAALLCDPDRSARNNASQAVAEMGALAATPDILNALATSLLVDRAGHMSFNAVRAFRRLIEQRKRIFERSGTLRRIVAARAFRRLNEQVIWNLERSGIFLRKCEMLSLEDLSQ